MWRGILIIGMWCMLAGMDANADDWPGWRGPNRDGKSPDKGLLQQWPENGPSQLWHITGIGQGFSSPSVVGDRIFITGNDETDLFLIALDLQGAEVWRIRVDAYQKSNPGAARATPVIDGEYVYIESGRGRVGCYKRSDGSVVWTRELTEMGGRIPNWGYSESVLIHGDLAVVTPGGKNCLTALDKRTGETVWQTSGYQAAAHYSSPIAIEWQGVEMIVQGTRGGLVCVSPKDGKILWTNNFCENNTANCPTPAFSNGYLFWANGYGKGGICLKLDVTDGVVKATEVWTSRDIVNHHGGYILHDGFIYGHHNNTWVCLKLETGTLMWKERGVGKGSLCFADGMLYTFGERGGVAALVEATPKEYQEHGRISVQGSGPAWAHPVVVRGRLYLRYADNLYCFDVSRP